MSLSPYNNIYIGSEEMYSYIVIYKIILTVGKLENRHRCEQADDENVEVHVYVVLNLADLQRDEFNMRGVIVIRVWQ